MDRVDPRDVFISYTDPNSAAASAVCEALEKADLSCWIAPRDIKLGERWRDAAATGLQQSRTFLLLLSRESARSQPVGDEVEAAKSLRRPLLLIRLEDAVAQDGLGLATGGYHWLNAFPGPIDAFLPQIVEAVRNALGGTRPAPRAAAQIPTDGPGRHLAPRNSPAVRRWMLVAVAAVLVATAAVGIVAGILLAGRSPSHAPGPSIPAQPVALPGNAGSPSPQPPLRPVAPDATAPPPALGEPPTGPTCTPDLPDTVALAQDYQGRCIGVPTGRSLWLVVDKGGRVHPQSGGGNRSICSGDDCNGPWASTAYFGQAADAGRIFQVRLVAADERADDAIQQYLRQSETSGEYPGMEVLPPDTTLLWSGTVTRR